MTNSSASKTPPTDVLTEQLVALLRESSVLNKLTRGRTPQKEPGDVATDDTYFPAKYGELGGPELSDIVDEHMPFFMDEEFAFYRVDDRLIVAPVQVVYDRAVREAGFATEDHRRVIHDLYECLYVRMLSDPLKGFTEREWQACREARELLGIEPAYRATPD